MQLEVDLFETECDLVVVAAIPGVAAEDLRVSATETALTIEGISPDPTDTAESLRWLWYLHEIPRGPFARTIDLPVKVDPLGARASLQNGLLRLEFPRAEIPRLRRIPVRAVGNGS